MTDTYEPKEGLCIGGPRDGQLLSSRDGFIRFRMAKFPPLGSPSMDARITSYLEVSTFTYRWMKLFNVGLWVDQEIAGDPEKILRAMAVGYRGRVYEA